MPHQIVPLKTIGLIGGSSSQATQEYYRLFNDGIHRVLGERNAAEVLIYSVNFQNIERLVRADGWNEIGHYLADKARRLELGGADFILLVSHTLHKVADFIVEAVSIPFVDMLDVTAEAVRQQGLRRLGILGTLPTMVDPYYSRRYKQYGIEIIPPDAAATREVDRIIFDELCNGTLLPASRAYYRSVVGAFRNKGAEGVILGCTEIKLLLDPSEFGEFPTFDTTTLHTARAVALALASGPENGQ